MLKLNKVHSKHVLNHPHDELIANRFLNVKVLLQPKFQFGVTLQNLGKQNRNSYEQSLGPFTPTSITSFSLSVEDRDIRPCGINQEK